MREMHVRAVREIAVGTEVGIAECLHVRDLRRAEPRLLRRRETEEQLRTVGDEVGTLDARSKRHLLRQPDAAIEPTPHESLPDAGHAEQAAQIVEDRCRSLGDVVEESLRKQHGDIVRLEQRRFRVARKPDRIFEHADRSLPRLRRTAVEREMADPPGRARTAGSSGAPRPPSRRDRPAWARTDRRDHREHARVPRGPPELRRRLADTQCRRDDLMVERRNEHLDAVVEHDTDPVQEVLLGEERLGRDARRCVTSSSTSL